MFMAYISNIAGVPGCGSNPQPCARQANVLPTELQGPIIIIIIIILFINWSCRGMAAITSNWTNQT